MLLPPINTPFCDWVTITYRSDRPDLRYVSRLFLEGYTLLFILLVVLILAGSLSEMRGSLFVVLLDLVFQ